MPTRTPVNRGFANPRAVFSVNPTIERPYTGGILQRGAPTVGRRLTFHKGQAFPDAPRWWLGPVNEWIVYWYLTFKKHYEEGRDFYYQAPVFVPFLFQSRDFTRIDFLVDLGPRSRAGKLGKYTALALDPFTEFTHPNPQADRDKRTELDKAGYLLIFLDATMLQGAPARVIEAALQGQDLSNRN